MTIDDFLQMDEMEQAEAIWSGKLAGTRNDNEYKILLYRINDFYVEVYNHIEHNVIKKLRPFDDPIELQACVQINLN